MENKDENTTIEELFSDAFNNTKINGVSNASFLQGITNKILAYSKTIFFSVFNFVTLTTLQTTT